MRLLKLFKIIGKLTIRVFPDVHRITPVRMHEHEFGYMFGVWRLNHLSAQADQASATTLGWLRPYSVPRLWNWNTAYGQERLQRSLS